MLAFIGRALLVAIFIGAGIPKILNPDEVAGLVVAKTPFDLPIPAEFVYYYYYFFFFFFLSSFFFF